MDEKNRTKAYVISQDSDLEHWSEQESNVYYIKSLADFIGLYSLAEEKLVEAVGKLFSKKENVFIKAIKDAFLNSGFVYSENWEAEVYDTVIDKVNVHEVNVIDVGDRRALISASVEIDFSASICGPDYENGYWDSEDKEYAYVPEFNFTHEFTDSYEVSIEFGFSKDMAVVREIISVVIDDGGDISLSIDEYPYK